MHPRSGARLGAWGTQGSPSGDAQVPWGRSPALLEISPWGKDAQVILWESLVLVEGSLHLWGIDGSLWGCPSRLRGVLGSSGGCPCCWGARSPREGDLGCMGAVPGCGGSRCWSFPERTQPWQCPELGCSEEPWGAPIRRGEATGAGYWGGGAGPGTSGVREGTRQEGRHRGGDTGAELGDTADGQRGGGEDTRVRTWRVEFCGGRVEDTRERNAAGGIRGN